jgi:hypothetical protein
MEYSYRPRKRIADVKPASALPSGEPLLRRPESFVEPGTTQENATELHYVSSAPLEPEYAKEQSPTPPRSPKLWARLSFFLLVGIGIGGAGYFLFHGVRVAIERHAEAGFAALQRAADDVSAERYDAARADFKVASREFEAARLRLRFFGGPLLSLTAPIPGLSRAASGESAVSAGVHIASAGPDLVSVAERLHQGKQAAGSGEEVSFLGLLRDTEAPLSRAADALGAADRDLERVNEADVPEDKRELFRAAKKNLGGAVGLIKSFQANEAVFKELLGGNGPRKYLFLFQNNNELRPTGGFIGTYALLDMNHGVVREFFVDGIFNPDGQLKENIVPPAPLQKISAGWSLHDSNWFPDFPTSAEKAIFFYEKTGGPTVDGVITLTPAVMERLLAITGPIELPKYGLTVTPENFIPVIQEQVEEKYDKEENKPKAVLADLSEELFDRVFSERDERKLFAMGNAFVSSLNQKDMLLYARNEEAEKIIEGAGWSGEMLASPSDYLSVVHANINGYKTDGVIDESIEHTSEIAGDGSVVDTVRITRTHKGGDTPYEWWNKVNADYLRVYVPEGSELLSASGMTWEFPEPPLDYERLGFRRDETVQAIEGSETVDEKTGTRIGRESGKTVFGNWVYVSPGESVTVEYRYKLPFSVRPEGGKEASFSVLYQKQAGTPGSALTSTIRYPEGTESVWQTGGNLVPYDRILTLKDALTTDKFSGLVLRLSK